MKEILLTPSVVSLLSACTTGEQMSRLEPGMTRQQVVGVLGRPDAVRSSGLYEQLEYTTSSDHGLVVGSLGLQGYSQGRLGCRIWTRRS